MPSQLWCGVRRHPLGAAVHDGCDFGVRIFNPDGGEAEKSGNGIRIFARYLWDTGQVGGEPFTIGTLGGPVKAQLFDNAQRIRVEMGTVSFSSDKIPVAGPSREVINETITVCGQPLTFCAATIGNPHCVVPCEDLAQVDVHGLGAALEVEARFPNRTNVQFLKVLDKNNIRIEIWERGAGYTLASGSSSSAAAAVARRLGLCDGEITVHMPGGALEIIIDDDFGVTLTGPVTGVCKGEILPDIFDALSHDPDGAGET